MIAKVDGIVPAVQGFALQTPEIATLGKIKAFFTLHLFFTGFLLPTSLFSHSRAPGRNF